MPTCDTGLCGLGGWGGPLPGDPSNDIVFTATSAYGGIDLQWSYPTTNPHAVGYIKVFRGGTADPASAIKIADVAGGYYFDKLTVVSTYYYWIQLISINGTVLDIVGPATATSKLSIEETILALSGVIDSGLLATALRAKIDQIALLDLGLADAVAARLADNAALQTVLDGVQTDLGEVNSLVLSERTTRIAENSAVITALDAMAVSVDGNTAAITSETTVRAGQVDVLTQRVDTLYAAGGAGGPVDPDFLAVVEVERLARVAADEAVASALTALLATSRSEVDANLTAAIQTEQTARATAVDAVASSVTSLQATLNTKIGTDIGAAIQVEESARVGADSALGLRIDTVQSNLTTAETTITGLVQTETQARVSDVGTLAESITTAQTTLNGSISSVRTDLTSEIGVVNGKVTSIGARWTALTDVNGLIGGFGVYNDGSTVEAGFNVDTFWVGRTTNKVKPFMISEGIVYINEAVIPTLTAGKIDTRGMQLRDDLGNIILGMGNALPLSFAPAGTLNSNIGINALGQFYGGGAGTGTPISNNQITVSGGVLQGIGTSGVQVDNAKLGATNLTDLSWWKRGVIGAAIPWTLNGEWNSIASVSSTGGADLLIAGPKGGNDQVWYCNENSGGGGEGGGWNGGPLIGLDPSKTYRFAIPIRRLTGQGSSYWGTTDVAILNTDTVNGNPYFANTGTLPSDRWFLFVGFIYPAGSVGNTNDGAGVYDCATGTLYQSGTNFCFRSSGAAGVTHRAYQFYATPDATQVFGRPMINLVDGTEPSLREYFEPSAVLNTELIPSISAAATTAQWSGVGDRPSDAELLNSYQVIGQNRVANSDWTSGYDLSATPYNSATIDQFAYSDTVWPKTSHGLSAGRTRNLVVHQNGVLPGGEAVEACDISGPSMWCAAQAGERVVGSVYVLGHRCSAEVFIGFWNQAANGGVGGWISFVEGVRTVMANGEANNLANYTRLDTPPTVVPAGTTEARLYIRKFNSNYPVVADSYLWFAAPQLEVVAANATGPSPYSPGPASDTRQLGYSGDLEATKGAPAGTYVGGVLAQNVESTTGAQAKADAAQTAAINDANTKLADKLSKSAESALNAKMVLDTSGAIWSRNTANTTGVVMAPSGLVGYKNGGVTFSINTDGDVVVKGDISGSTIGAGLGLNVNGATWANEVEGFWTGLDGGVAKARLGNGTTYLKWSPSAGLEMKMNALAFDVTNGNYAGGTSGSAIFTAPDFTAVVSQGVGPYTYIWDATQVSTNSVPSVLTGGSVSIEYISQSQVRLRCVRAAAGSFMAVSWSLTVIDAGGRKGTYVGSFDITF